MCCLLFLISKKPGNIFLDAEGNIKLGDFGLATRRHEKSKPKYAETESVEMNAIYNAIEGAGALLGENSVLSHSIISHTSGGGESMTGGGELIFGNILFIVSLFTFLTYK